MLATIGWLGWAWLGAAAILALAAMKWKLKPGTVLLFLMLLGAGWAAYGIVYSVLWLVWTCLPLIIVAAIIWLLHKKFTKPG